jgi:hypothetical protein
MLETSARLLGMLSLLQARRDHERLRFGYSSYDWTATDRTVDPLRHTCVLHTGINSSYQTPYYLAQSASTSRSSGRPNSSSSYAWSPTASRGPSNDA